MLLSIIVVSYNTSDLTQQTLKSADHDAHSSSLLRNQTELIVIDNNSSDSSVADLKKLSLHHRLQLIENKKNTGFAAANNQGIAAAKGEYILLLNSDTVVQPGALEKLVQTFIKHPEDPQTSALSSYSGRIDNIGIVAAMLLNPDQTLQAQGGDLPTLGSVFSQLFFIDDLPLIGRLVPSTQHTGKNIRYSLVEQKLIPMGWVGGTALIFPQSLVAAIGDLDSNIFMYTEDMEFCLRAKAHLYDVVIQPQAQIIHYGSQSGSSAKALAGELQGLKYIWAKHKPHWQIPLVNGMLKLGCLARWLLFSTISPNSQKAAAYHQLLHTL